MSANLPQSLNRAIANAVAGLPLGQRTGARLDMERLIVGLQPAQASALADDASMGGGTPLLRWWRESARVRDSAGDTLRALPSQRAQVRELIRTNPIAGGAIRTNVDRVVGTGLALVAQPDRRVLGWTQDQALEFKRAAQTEFSLWADSNDCDWTGQQNFYDKQGLTLGAALESGDCFTNMPDGEPSATQPYRLRLQTIEADRVGNPNNAADSMEVAGGVRRAPRGGAPTAFHVYDVHPGTFLVGAGSRFAGEWVQRIGEKSGRRRILHHFRQLRPEQPRGVPYLAPVIDCIKQLGRYTEAEIQAAVVSAFLTMVIETPTGAPLAPIFAGADGAAAAAAAGSNEIAMAPGAVIGLAAGEKATFSDPSRPNPAFQPFIEAILTQIGMGLGIPFEVLIKRFNSSYSASKAALLDAWMWFRGQRVWLARSFCQPVYETWMAEAVATGRLAAPGFFQNPLMRWAYTRAAWHGDSMGSINPKDEIAGYLAAVEGRVMTRERAEWELFGTDWYETFESKATEQEMLKEADLLPVPKAGAPAAPTAGTPPPAKPDDTTDLED